MEDGSVVSTLGGADDVYNWLEKSIAPLFSAPVCGNLVCENGEFKAFQNYGCLSDCGSWTEVTNVTVRLEFSQPSPHYTKNLEFKICEKHTRFCMEMPDTALIDNTPVQAFSASYPGLLPNKVPQVTRGLASGP